MDRDPRELDGAWTRFQHHEFPEPAPDLAAFVLRYWRVSWDYATPFRQKVVPYPHVHLTVRPGGTPEVHGVARRHAIRVLEGRGSVLGVQFRPGAFRPFLRAPVSTIADRTVPAAAVPGLPGRPAEPTVEAVEAWLRPLLPAHPDPRAEAAVARAATDSGISRVDQLAQAQQTSVRALQRLFAEHVGIGPKWVIRRYRLHEVTERMAAGGRVDWAVLAADLGYTDQPHLIRDFTDLFGEPPTWYARRYP